MRYASFKFLFFLGGIVVAGALLLSLPLSRAQDQVSAGAQVIPQPQKKGMVQCAVPVERTVEQMEAADAELAWLGKLPSQQASQIKPLLTPIGEAAYRALKEQLAGASTKVKPESQAPLGTTPNVHINFNGVNQTEAGGFLPPDTHAASGTSHVVEVTNLHVDMYYNTTPHTRIKSVTLGSFFGYGYPNNMSDPRVIFDPVWKRFVVVAINTPPVAQPITIIFIAVSKSANPKGAWWVYQVNIDATGAVLWDYPMLGMDQDGIIISGNLYHWTPGVGPGTYISTDCITMAKARLYNGGAFKTVWWTNLHWSAQPPVVLPPADPALMKNATHLVSADPYSDNTKIFVHTLKDSAYPATQSLTSSNITVPAYSIPPAASQPGTSATLDTLDGRFLNYSTQIFDAGDGGADKIFQAHTVAAGSYAMPRFYLLKIPTLTVEENRSFWVSATSHDFNASIAANNGRDMFVTWSSTDPPAGKNAQIRASGKLAGELDISAGKTLVTSSTFYTGERWGDYSSVHLDPTSVASKRAWICNQYTLPDGTWGTRIARIGFPLP
jgi:hypothetical protein